MYRVYTPEYCERVLGVLAPGWYALDAVAIIPAEAGRHVYWADLPARGPFRTGPEICNALWLFADRTTGAGHVDDVSPMILGPFRTRQQARTATRDNTPESLQRKVTLVTAKQA